MMRAFRFKKKPEDPEFYFHVWTLEEETPYQYFYVKGPNYFDIDKEKFLDLMGRLWDGANKGITDV